jgi:hypothetical protein
VWVANIQTDGRVEEDLFIYIDDFRPKGSDEEEFWQANRNAGSICNHLGIHDAPIKSRGEYLTPVPWTGSMVYTDNLEELVGVLISHKKWDNIMIFI